MSKPPDEKPRIFTEFTPNEDGLEVWVDEELVELFSFDDIGSVGFHAIRRLVEKLQMKL